MAPPKKVIDLESDDEESQIPPRKISYGRNGGAGRVYGSSMYAGGSGSSLSVNTPSRLSKTPLTNVASRGIARSPNIRTASNLSKVSTVMDFSAFHLPANVLTPRRSTLSSLAIDEMSPFRTVKKRTPTLKTGDTLGSSRLIDNTSSLPRSATYSGSQFGLSNTYTRPLKRDARSFGGFDEESPSKRRNSQVMNSEISDRGRAPAPRPRRELPVRNGDLERPWESIRRITHQVEDESLELHPMKTLELRPMKTVELKDGTVLGPRTFLKIKLIAENTTTGEVFLHGWLLRRNTPPKDIDRVTGQDRSDGKFNRKLNEVHFVYQRDLDDPRPVPDQSVVRVSIDQVVRIRKLRETNQSYPACRYNQEDVPADIRGDMDRHMKYAHDNLELVVRSKFTKVFEDAASRFKGAGFDEDGEGIDPKVRPKEQSIEYLREDETAASLSMIDKLKTQTWNPNIIYGGSRQTIQKKIPAELRGNTLNEDGNLKSAAEGNSTSSSWIAQQPHQRPNNRTTQNYTCGDFCSGAGGTICGMVAAGLKCLYGLDFWSIACKTLKLNNPEADIYQMSLQELLEALGKDDPRKDLYVDILHISPPCQPYSPANTLGGPNNEDNQATLLAVMPLIKIVRPRIVTVEQTFGIQHTAHVQFLNGMINIFATEGYSVRWSVLNLADYGVPQSRKRLIMIAAAPGEPLPTFPPPTHSGNVGNGLEPSVTINDVLRTVPRNATNHDPVMFLPAKYKAPYSGDKQAGTITTKGYILHPGGKRYLTLREMAAIQTFPHDHTFVGTLTDKRKQIGNAVPPKFAEVLFRHIVKHLKRHDDFLQEVHVIED